MSNCGWDFCFLVASVLARTSLSETALETRPDAAAITMEGRNDMLRVVSGETGTERAVIHRDANNLEATRNNIVTDR